MQMGKHARSIWTSISPGDVVAIHLHDDRSCVGTMESSTTDGLIIWIRDELNERHLFHLEDCASIRLISKGEALHL